MKKVIVRDDKKVWNLIAHDSKVRRYLISEGYCGSAGESTTPKEKANWESFCDRYAIENVYELIMPIASKVIGSRANILKDALLWRLIEPADHTCAMVSRDHHYYVAWLLKTGEEVLLAKHGDMADNKYLGSYNNTYYVATIKAYVPQDLSFLADHCILLWEVESHKKEDMPQPRKNLKKVSEIGEVC